MNRYQTENLFASEETEQVTCSRIVRVSFESGVDAEFDYLVPDKLLPIETGQRVKVPFGRSNKKVVGFCVDVEPSEKSDANTGTKKKFKLKKVLEVIDAEPLIDASLLELARWISGYYVCPLGQVLAAVVPSAVKKGAGVKQQKYIYLAEEIDDQTRQLKGAKQKQIVSALQEKKADCPDTSVELNALLEKVGCTKAPMKRLLENRIVKVVHKEILKALPAIPEGLSIKTDKVTLNSDQEKALDHITDRIEAGGFDVTVLHGVTDSGKTEVYIRAIDAVLKAGKSAIVILPEIALTAQTVQRFSSRFENIAVMHSGLSAAQRNAQWQKIKSGKADVVIGARSAVFAPLPNVGLIVVDEEHEPSYKQDTVPRYNGRDVAIKRMQLCGGHCILGSATPSLETLANCQSKKHFSRVVLPKRVMDLPMPEMKLVDLKQQFSNNGVDLISAPLAKKLREVLAKKDQAILFLNRRGYSNFVFCSSCKHTLNCRNCDVTLTFHKSKTPKSNRMQTVSGKHMNHGRAVCHYCLSQTLVPEKCPLCGKKMTMIGLGSQR